MNKKEAKKRESWNPYASDWIWEGLMIAMILPAIVYGALSLGHLPIA